jgi:hypothetical protein
MPNVKFNRFGVDIKTGRRVEEDTIPVISVSNFTEYVTRMKSPEFVNELMRKKHITHIIESVHENDDDTAPIVSQYWFTAWLTNDPVTLTIEFPRECRTP